RAVSLLAEAGGGRGRGQPGKPVGVHPADALPITLHSGRYGPYLRHGKAIASLPRGMNPDEITVDRAVDLLAARAEKAKTAPAGTRAPRGAKPKAAAKTRTKRAAGSKPKAGKPATAE